MQEQTVKPGKQGKNNQSKNHVACAWLKASNRFFHMERPDHKDPNEQGARYETHGTKR
jgi:hypothetical protein